MKKIALLVLTALFMLTFVGCSQKASIYDQGLEVAEIIDDMIRNEEYLGFPIANTMIMDSYKRSLGDRTTPAAVYELTPSESTISSVTEVLSSFEMSDELRNYTIQNSVTGVIAAMSAGIAGEDDVGLISLKEHFSFTKAFVNEDFEGFAVYLYTYKDTSPIIVTFTSSGNGAVIATGYLIMYGSVDTTSEEYLKSRYELANISVTRVK